MIYLDNSATTRVCDAAAKAVVQGMQGQYYNPSSKYAPAVAVERHVDSVRERVSNAMGAKRDEIYFTSGGTESNNIAILGTCSALRAKRWRIISTPMEHASVYNIFSMLERAGHEVLWLTLTPEGRIDLNELAYLVDENTDLVSIMHVNNEFGSVSDIEAISKTIKSRNPNTLFHSDGVQAFGKLQFKQIPADLYSISGHKFYAPKGIGALKIRSGAKNGGGLIGGGQEKGVRSGTLNAAGIMGLGAALEQIGSYHEQQLLRISQCKARLWGNLIQAPDVLINGPSLEDGAPHILNMSFMGVRGEVMLHALEEQGIYVSTGSACSAKRQGPNRVLASIGIDGKRAESAIRFSLSPYNTIQEMDIVADVIYSILGKMRKYQPR